MFRKTPLLPAALTITAAATAYALIVAPNARQPISGFSQDSVSAVVRPLPGKLHAGAMWPELRWYLKALGNRLEQSGKERLLLAGTLERADSGRATIGAWGAHSESWSSRSFSRRRPRMRSSSPTAP